MIGKRKIGQLQSDGFLYFLFLKEGGRVFVGANWGGALLGWGKLLQCFEKGS